jgi:hypothetical protein
VKPSPSFVPPFATRHRATLPRRIDDDDDADDAVVATVGRIGQHWSCSCSRLRRRTRRRTRPRDSRRETTTMRRRNRNRNRNRNRRAPSSSVVVVIRRTSQPSSARIHLSLLFSIWSNFDRSRLVDFIGGVPEQKKRRARSEKCFPRGILAHAGRAGVYDCRI